MSSLSTSAKVDKFISSNKPQIIKLASAISDKKVKEADNIFNNLISREDVMDITLGLSRSKSEREEFVKKLSKASGIAPAMIGVVISAIGFVSFKVPGGPIKK